MFALMDLDALKQLQLTGAEWSVLHCIMRATDPENNQAPITVQQIAADCEMAEPNVSRIMRELRGRRVVTTLRRGIQKVNPHIMHRGQIDDWNTATDHELEPIWSRST